MSDPFVVACIPALNEESTIDYVVRGALQYVDLVVVVDDLSDDNTAEYARRAGARVIRLKRRRRVGGVIKAGLSYLKCLHPDVVVILDADGQHNPHEIPKLLHALSEDGVDWVIGSRYLHNSHSDNGWSRWFFRQKRHIFFKGLGNWFFSKLVSFLSRHYITDTMSGFKALSVGALNNLELKFDYAYCPEMAIILCIEGYKLSEVPINCRKRHRGESKVVNNILPYGIKQLAIIFYTFLNMSCKKII